MGTGGTEREMYRTPTDGDTCHTVLPSHPVLHHLEYIGTLHPNSVDAVTLSRSETTRAFSTRVSASLVCGMKLVEPITT